MLRRGSRPAAAAAGVALALLVGAGLLGGCDRPRARYEGIASTSTTESGTDAVRGFRSPRNYRPTAVPVRLQIPAIGVDTPLQRLGKGADGTVQTPAPPHKWDQAGWYDGEGGTRPGDPGSAVILGHVDSYRGPAVFFRLRSLRPGDRVEVDLADGGVARFAVRALATYPKLSFPARQVYASHGGRSLQLVTCGGEFDPRARSYLSNVVVYTELVSVVPPSRR
jgi:sortase family protein